MRLSERIGVRGTALNWFRSYLEDWSTQVDIDGELSDPAISRFGLPQGSVVGPIGFTAYNFRQDNALPPFSFKLLFSG